jgi:hypothetical protein
LAAGAAGPRRIGSAEGGVVSLNVLISRRKKQGAAGITTAAPYIAGQWGRGE